MPNRDFLSIDQNCHSLWDTLPKLQALGRMGHRGIHCVEDVDVAFTRRGAGVGDYSLELARERVFRGGAMEWGAALFYTDFLGRLPLDIRRLEPYTGWSSAALSRRLGETVDDLYDRYSSSDNWQLIGPSYVDESRYHRVIGDLTVDEVAPFLRQLMTHAEKDMIGAFPEADARERIGDWFGRENALVEELIRGTGGGTLVTLYEEWLRTHLPAQIRVETTSQTLASESCREGVRLLLGLFVTEYDSCVAAYNSAIEEAGVGLNPLRGSVGELPFFAVIQRDGRMVRTTVNLQDGALHAGDLQWPIDMVAGRFAGGQLPPSVRSIVGKALVLVLQVRLQPGGSRLALPRQGSLYMPAAHAFERNLRACGLLTAPVHEIERVRLGFLERWSSCRTRIRVPDYLCPAFSSSELLACEFSEELPVVVARCRKTLAQLVQTDGREAVARELSPRLYDRRAGLEDRRRQLARDPATRAQAGPIWDEIKDLDRQLLRGLVDAVVLHLRVSELDYYDSRGALLPWSIALGGKAFYEQLLDHAELSLETCNSPGGGG
ncbi:MAG: hypothetical protein HN742_27390 [Lentisphaerae bacterium]|jgi:hypothetical protein|nr:hypothetical protein [Lentisphaerota bacterium]MBT4819398.1 hypothetical protein [Lentisphaerota bacterium]MBT5604590.1 hypothetical protein [Lentisphaerota bacterium]MBT7062207.1 hypothetical protein [Lentisphaerota bacterium]MBT7845628.1 hypothetical protein [Lentisphaerota bacterium]